MSRYPARGRGLSLWRRSLGAVTCVAVLLLSGCAGRKARAFPWNTAVLVRPCLPAPPAPSSEAPPDLRPLIPEPSPRLVMTRTVPPRPHTTNAPDAGEAGRALRPEAPMIVPQLPPEETAAAQQQTNESLAIAERNLNTAMGRPLSPAEADLAAKIRSFIDQAGEAAHGGDWARARTLAKKAQVLSEDLVRTL